MKVYLAYTEHYPNLLKEANARVMISYGRKHNLPLGDYIPEGFNDYLIDSGGFQFHQGTLERTLSLDAYCLWLHLAKERHGDVIKGWMGIDTKCPIESLENYEKMSREGLPCIPVWKAFWSDDVLDYLCSEYEYIAIGGVAFTARKDKLRQVWEKVITRYPHVKVHMLGVGVRSGTTFKTFRPYSIDVSTWMASFRFGMELVYDKKQVIRETSLPDELKQRLRDDKKYEESEVRKAIKLLQSLETSMDDYHDPYQTQMNMEEL